jgi:hypothetical protein
LDKNPGALERRKPSALGVTAFNKDQCRICANYTAENIAIIRRFAVNLSRQQALPIFHKKQLLMHDI